MPLANGLIHRFKKLIHLLHRPARVGMGRRGVGYLRPHRVKGRVVAQASEQVVRAAVDAHVVPRFHGVLADLLVQHLAVAGGLDDTLHHEVFRDQKGQVLSHPAGHHGRIDHQARGDFLVEHQDGVRRQEGFRDAQPLVGGIVDGTLEPLPGGGKRRVETVADHVPRQRRDALTARRVALVGHRR